MGEAVRKEASDTRISLNNFRHHAFPCFFVLLFCTASFCALGKDGEQTEILFFHKAGCAHSARVNKFLKTNIENNYPVTVKRFEIHKPENAQLVRRLAKIYKVEAAAPIVFVGKDSIEGDDRKSLLKLARAVRVALRGDLISPLDRLKSEEKTSKGNDSKKLGNTLTLPAVIAASAVDAVNPCAFAVLTLLLGTILLASRNKKRVIYAGFAFTASTFVSYLAMGFGLYKAIEMTGVRHYVYISVGILAMLIGIWNMKDFFWYGRWFTIEVPMAWRPKLKLVVSSVTSIPGAFFVGFLTSLFLLPCTSGPYVVVIGMLSESATHIQAVWYLTLYNVIFVLPFIFITLAVSFGVTTTARIEKWRQEKLPKLHFALGIVMFTLGTVIVGLAIWGVV